MAFFTNKASRDVSRELLIIKTKSARGNGIAAKVLRSLRIQPTKHCSKYCIGMAALGQLRRHNWVLPALRRLDLMRPAKAA